MRRTKFGLIPERSSKDASSTTARVALPDEVARSHHVNTSVATTATAKVMRSETGIVPPREVAVRFDRNRPSR